MWFILTITDFVISLALLHLADNFVGFGQTLDHLLALLPSTNRVFALAQKILEIGGSVDISD